MTSWIMQLWMKTHDESEWPDLSICQGDDTTHVLDAAKHPSKQSIEKMCSEDFFAKHSYRYVEKSVDGDSDNETYAYASYPPRSRLEETRTLVRNQDCQEPNSSQSNEEQLTTNEDASGYSLPFEETTGKSNGTRLRSERECQHMTEFARTEEHESLEQERDQASPFRRNQQYQDPNRSQSNEVQVVSDEDASGYSLPPEETSDKSDDTRLCTDIENQTRAACYRDEGIPGCKRRHNEICDAENSQNTSQHQTSAKIEGKICNVQNSNMDFKYPVNFSEYDTPTGLQKMCKSDQEGCTIFDKPVGIYQNITCKMGQGDCTIQPNIPKDRKCQPMTEFARSEELGSLEKGGYLASPLRRSKAIRRKKAQRCQSKKQAKRQQGNKENIYENTISRSQCVPQSEPVYANMQTEVETRHSSCEESSREEENLFHEDGVGVSSPNHGHGAGVERHNSALQNFLTSVEVDFDDPSI